MQASSRHKRQISADIVSERLDPSSSAVADVMNLILCFFAILC